MCLNLAQCLYVFLVNSSLHHPVYQKCRDPTAGSFSWCRNDQTVKNQGGPRGEWGEGGREPEPADGVWEEGGGVGISEWSGKKGKSPEVVLPPRPRKEEEGKRQDPPFPPSAVSWRIQATWEKARVSTSTGFRATSSSLWTLQLQQRGDQKKVKFCLHNSVAVKQSEALETWSRATQVAFNILLSATGRGPQTSCPCENFSHRSWRSHYPPHSPSPPPLSHLMWVSRKCAVSEWVCALHVEQIVHQLVILITSLSHSFPGSVLPEMNPMYESADSVWECTWLPEKNREKKKK